MLDSFLANLRNLYSNVDIDSASKCTLNNPSFGKYFKTLDVIASLDYFKYPTTDYFDQSISLPE